MNNTGKRKKLVLLLVGILLFTIVLSACARRPDNQVPSPGTDGQTGVQDDTLVTTYFPLQAGNRWIYQGEGNEFAAFTREVLYRVGNRIQLVRADAGARLMQIVEERENSIVLVFSEENVEGNENILNVENNREQILLQGPVEVGTSWEYENRRSVIQEKGLEIETPAGTFGNCIKVLSTFEGEEHQIFEYYAPGVGMIKTVFMAGQDMITSDLESYTLNQQ